MIKFFQKQNKYLVNILRVRYTFAFLKFAIFLHTTFLSMVVEFGYITLKCIFYDPESVFLGIFNLLSFFKRPNTSFWRALENGKIIRDLRKTFLGACREYIFEQYRYFEAKK